jgi:hypothetical protein
MVMIRCGLRRRRAEKAAADSTSPATVSADTPDVM